MLPFHVDPAYKNATRVPGGNFPEIPSLPISYEDALPLLRSVQGLGRLAKEVGDDWEGGLTDDVEYWTGPSEKEIRFVNEVDTKETPIWSVFAYIPGHIKVSYRGASQYKVFSDIHYRTKSWSSEITVTHGS